MSQLELPSEGLKFLYALHKECSKDLQEKEGVLRFTPEEGFWTVFAVVAVCLWEGEDEAEYEVRLSELLRLYLTIYLEDLNPNLSVGDEPDFLEDLRKKFYEVREIVRQSEDIEDAPRKLGLWLRTSVKQSHAIRLVMGTLYIPMLFNAIFPLPFRFVQDV